MKPLVQVDNLVKNFPLDRDHYIGAVNHVSLTIDRGETLGLVGESGSGKTTVGRCLLRLVEPTAGSVLFDGQDLTSLSERELRRMRTRMQLVFQEPMASLNPRRTVGRTVEEPLNLAGEQKGRRRTRVREMIRAVGLTDAHLDRFPRRLTASEQQRVGIARALITRPDLVVLDEPTSTLDQSARGEILDVLAEQQQRLGTAYLFISHDLTAVERISHRIAVMYLGRVVESGPTDDIFARQQHPYSKALLSAVVFPDPRRRPARFLLSGEIPSAVNPQDCCPLHGRCPIGVVSCLDGFPSAEQVTRDHSTHCFRWRELGDHA